MYVCMQCDRMNVYLMNIYLRATKVSSDFHNKCNNDVNSTKEPTSSKWISMIIVTKY